MTKLVFGSTGTIPVGDNGVSVVFSGHGDTLYLDGSHNDTLKFIGDNQWLSCFGNGGGNDTIIDKSYGLNLSLTTNLNTVLTVKDFQLDWAGHITLADFTATPTFAIKPDGHGGSMLTSGLVSIDFLGDHLRSDQVTVTPTHRLPA